MPVSVLGGRDQLWTINSLPTCSVVYLRIHPFFKRFKILLYYGEQTSVEFLN